MNELSLTENFQILHQRLSHAIPMYGTACLKGDKEGAKNLLAKLKEDFAFMNDLIKSIERLEHLAYETQSILGVVTDNDLS